MMNFIIKSFFKDSTVKTFFITRLAANEIEEKVYFKKDEHLLDITHDHSMICLDPFCIAVWLPAEQANTIDTGIADIHFKKGDHLNAVINVMLIETRQTENGVLFLYEVKKVKNRQFSALHRLLLFSYLLRSKKNTYYSRKVISALYSYPRRIIIVSYKDDEYYNIFPMDIQGCITRDNLYLLGLRTTNATLDKILKARKVVIADTDKVDINTVYNLGKHSSDSPVPKNELPFGTINSEVFCFPVPAFSGSYQEVEIISHRKMGYHMLMVGKVINFKEINPQRTSLYHVGFLQFKKSGYTNQIDGLF